ncbi:ribonuclease H-like domain-containing protein [Lipomyces japonicus]|uniref:ribonuclease H-like domain-containing protein n=1 Tax=Lipomyces japonicus TaxID=56871 RepID=UPI0034CEEEB6
MSLTALRLLFPYTPRRFCCGTRQQYRAFRLVSKFRNSPLSYQHTTRQSSSLPESSNSESIEADSNNVDTFSEPNSVSAISSGILSVNGEVSKIDIPEIQSNNTSNASHNKRLQQRRTFYVWVDIETTGLNFPESKIIEICCFITDQRLNLIEKNGFEAIVGQPKSVMDSMGDWCIKAHEKSGLTKRVLESTTTKEEVEQQLLEYLKKHIGPNEGLLAGNSIHFDRDFLLHDMPLIPQYLRPRIIDVSTIHELAKATTPKIVKDMPKKKYLHLARQDILESINELRYYYNHIFKAKF